MTVKIDLRADGWFEAGKDAKKSFPFAFMAYQIKRELKKQLSALNGQGLDREQLEQKLGEIDVGHNSAFKGSPYIKSSDIYIDTHGLPGEAYLGTIVEKKAS